jgi:serine/threonine protein kinase
MTLGVGARLGPYEVLSALGAGGMGEVYRARDTKLNRDVALKILPNEWALDRERLARFEREARMLAALNHPNIAHIHGFDDATDTPALVMELVEGPTLADRIATGPMPFDEALAIAKQVADALEAAHEQGIIHRDLKPANIKVRDDGTVKVLDFGLAKALENPASEATTVNATQSPTITTPAIMTGVGMILGTAAYMSPEQAKGRPADKRSDIWAFGCVLFEMLTGTRAFDGEDATEVIAAVVRGEPDWNVLPADVPDHIRLLLRRCLEKDRGKRVSDGSGRAVFAAAGAGPDLHEHRPPRDRDFAGWPTDCLRRESAVASAGARVDGGAPDRRCRRRDRWSCVTDLLSRRPNAGVLRRSRAEADCGHRWSGCDRLPGRQPVRHLVGRHGDRVWTGREGHLSRLAEWRHRGTARQRRER